MSQVIRCNCTRALAVLLDDGSYEMQYKKRIIEFWGPAKITCQECGTVKVLDRQPVVAIA